MFLHKNSLTAFVAYFYNWIIKQKTTNGEWSWNLLYKYLIAIVRKTHTAVLKKLEHVRNRIVISILGQRDDAMAPYLWAFADR